MVLRAAVLAVVMGLFAAEALAQSRESAHETPFEAFLKGDFTKSFRLSRPLAERGDGDARHNINLIYADGDARAQFAIAEMFALGDGVPQSDGEAVRWYRKAAQQGHAGADYAMGLAYFLGRGVRQDDVQAYAWFVRARSFGVRSFFPDHDDRLAMMHAAGKQTDLEARMSAADLAEAKRRVSTLTSR